MNCWVVMFILGIHKDVCLVSFKSALTAFGKLQYWNTESYLGPRHSLCGRLPGALTSCSWCCMSYSWCNNAHLTRCVKLHPDLTWKPGIWDRNTQSKLAGPGSCELCAHKFNNQHSHPQLKCPVIDNVLDNVAKPGADCF